MFSSNFNKKIRTLLIFVSITGSGRFQAKAQIALAVYGQIHGRFSSFSFSFGRFHLYILITSCAHSWSLNALELNHNPDQ
jgi:hypothetical protein